MIGRRRCGLVARRGVVASGGEGAGRGERVLEAVVRRCLSMEDTGGKKSFTANGHGILGVIIGNEATSGENCV
jgi:hypothetical protein